MISVNHWMGWREHLHRKRWFFSSFLMGIVPIKRTNLLVKKMVLVPFFQTYPNHDNHVHPPKKQPRCGRPYSDDKWGSYGLWLWCADRTEKRASEHQRVPAGREKDGLLHPTGCWCIKIISNLTRALSWYPPPGQPSLRCLHSSSTLDVLCQPEGCQWAGPRDPGHGGVESTRSLDSRSIVGPWGMGGVHGKPADFGVSEAADFGVSVWFQNPSRHRLQTAGVDWNTEIKAKWVVPLLRFCGIFCILSWPKHHCYPLVYST